MKNVHMELSIENDIIWIMDGKKILIRNCEIQCFLIDEKVQNKVHNIILKQLVLKCFILWSEGNNYILNKKEQKCRNMWT